MILDTSALVAVLRREPEADAIFAVMRAAGALRVSAGFYLEASIVEEGRRGAGAVDELDALAARLNVEIVPFTAKHARLAREAFRRFGKGRHPAGLNFGDCMAYALARERGEPLLFKGGDFARTDIEPATY